MKCQIQYSALVCYVLSLTDFTIHWLPIRVVSIFLKHQRSLIFFKLCSRNKLPILFLLYLAFKEKSRLPSIKLYDKTWEMNSIWNKALKIKKQSLLWKLLKNCLVCVWSIYLVLSQILKHSYALALYYITASEIHSNQDEVDKHISKS